MPTVPILPVHVACVHSTICLSAPITKDLCQPLFTKFLFSHSYVTSLCEVELLIPCIFCVILQLHPAICSVSVCFEGCMHFCHHILHSCILVFSRLFPGLKIQQGCNFHSHCEPFAYFLTDTGYINTSYGWEILVTLTVLLAVLSITTTALLLWKRKASNNQIKNNTSPILGINFICF